MTTPEDPHIPQQIALQNVTATTIRIGGSINQISNFTQRPQALAATVNDRLPPVPQGNSWQVRKEENTLMQWLRTSQYRLVGLHSAGGYGKSATVAQVYKAVSGFEHKLWVNFQEPVEFDTFGRWVIRQVLGDDRYQKNRDLHERCDAAELVNEVLSLLLKQRCLLVLDNLETLFQAEALWNPYGEFLNSWLTGNGGGVVVLTSQFRLELPMGNVWQWIGLRGLEAKQGMALLRSEQIIGTDKDLEAFVAVANGHPLLLTLTVNLLKRRYKDDSEKPEILRLEKDDVTLLREIREAHREDSDASVGKVLDLSFERLYPIWLRVLLQRLSVLRGSFGLEAAQAMTEEHLTLSEMRNLARWSFVLEQRQDEEWTFNFLPLIQRYLQSGAIKSGELTKAHESAIAFYEAHYQGWNGTIASCREELEVFYHCCELGQYGKARAALDRCWNPPLKRRGDYQKLLPLYERLVDVLNSLDPLPQNDLAMVMLSLGMVYRQIHRTVMAISYYEQALELIRETSDKAMEVACLCDLADLHCNHAYGTVGPDVLPYKRAIRCWEQALAIKREFKDRQGEVKLLWKLDQYYYQVGRLKYARQARHQAYLICQELQTLPPPSNENFISRLMWRFIFRKNDSDWANRRIKLENRLGWFWNLIFTYNVCAEYFIDFSTTIGGVLFSLFIGLPIWFVMWLWERSTKLARSLFSR